ncbi:hypothetical protein R1flu_023586 [Riccia fluitans]|uniref:Proteasome component Ecm29 N-terminal domain-containing protein n=1 Tax=Riccia fluitans TaxID=41844 RepID=A0ABD1XSY9_9MARC
MASPHQATKLKVMEMLNHINKREWHMSTRHLRNKEKWFQSYFWEFGTYELTTRMSSCDSFEDFPVPATSVTQEGTAAPDAPPGLSPDQATRVWERHPPRCEQLVQRKLGLLNFVGELELGADLLCPLFLVASVDNNEKVAKRVCIDCISGAGSTTRLKQAGMEFSVWIFKHAVDRQLKVMAPLILSGVIKLLTGSSPVKEMLLPNRCELFCYQAIGQLAQRAPHLFSGSTEMVIRLFEALKVEAVSTRSNIQEALASLTGAFKDCSSEVAAELEALLLKHVKAEEDEARFCSVLWASRWNSFTHTPSRYLCMLGAADTKLDIREMAQQGLVPPKNEKTGAADAAYPSLKQMLDYIYQQQDRIRSPAPIGEQILLFPSKTYVAMIEFLKKCFEAERKDMLVVLRVKSHCQ